MKNIENLRQDW